MKAQVTAPVSPRFRLILITALLAVTMMGFAAPAARNIRELNFAEAEIAVVLKALADLGGTNIVVGPGVKGPITVSLKDVTVDDALKIITAQCGLDYAQVNGTYVVNTPQLILPLKQIGVNAGETGNIVVELKYLSPAEAITALGVAYRDLQVTGVGTRLVLVGNNKRLDAAKAFLGTIDTQDTDDSSAVVTLKYTTIQNATTALAMIYKDVVVSTLSGEKQRIVLSGDKKRVDAAKAFIAQLDTALPEQTITEAASEKSYQVKNVVPWQAKEYLESLFGSRGLKVSYAPKMLDAAQQAQPATAPVPAALVGPEGAKEATATKVDWSSRTLVLRGPATVVDEAIASLAKADVAVTQAEQRCSVKRIFASHAIAYLLERYEARGLSIYTAPMNYQEILAGKEETEAGAKLSKGGGGQIGALVRRNADGQLNIAEPIGDFILRGAPELVAEAAKTLEAIDIGPERVTEVVKVNYLKAADVKKQLDELFNKQGLQVSLAPSLAVQPFSTSVGTVSGDSDSSGSGTSDKGKTDVIADLVLRGSEEVVASAIQLVQQMDVEPQLVSIKAQIISMDADAEKTLGVQWPGSLSTTLTEQDSGDPLKFGTILRDPVSLKVTLNALETQHKLKVISRPGSVVRNGNVSLIHVGKTVTFERFVGLDSAGNKVFSTETIDTGVSMQLRPLVSADGVITVDIMAAITSDPAFRVSASGSDLPTVTTTTTTTTVQVRDGETLVIGGLTQEKQEERRSGVPLLSKIPLIGGAFRNKTTTPTQTDLVIMITPTILKPGSPEAVTAPVVQ